MCFLNLSSLVLGLPFSKAALLCLSAGFGKLLFKLLDALFQRPDIRRFRLLSLRLTVWSIRPGLYIVWHGRLASLTSDFVENKKPRIVGFQVCLENYLKLIRVGALQYPPHNSQPDK